MSEHNHYPIFVPNHEEEQDRIVIPDEHGDENFFDVLFTFEVPDTDQSYVVVTPAEEDSDDAGDEQEVFAFRYEENGDEFKLFAIETDEEWDMVEEMINTFSEEEEE